MDILKNYIDGSWQNSASKETIDVVKPGRSRGFWPRYLTVPKRKDDVEHAVTTAQKAYKEWSKVPVMKRVQGTLPSEIAAWKRTLEALG